MSVSRAAVPERGSTSCQHAAVAIHDRHKQGQERHGGSAHTSDRAILFDACVPKGTERPFFGPAIILF